MLHRLDRRNGSASPRFTKSLTTPLTKRSPGHADKIEVTIHLDNSITVIDNGRGIPVDNMDIDGEKIPAAQVVMTNAARRRQVRQQLLQSFGRPARRRRELRERAQ